MYPIGALMMYLFGVLFIDNLYVPSMSSYLLPAATELHPANLRVQHPCVHPDLASPLRRLLLPQEHCRTPTGWPKMVE